VKYSALTIAFGLLLSTGTMVHGEEANNTNVPASSPQNPNVKFVTKLSGLVLFATNSCPDILVDFDRFKEVSTSLGVEVDALSKEPIRLESLSYFSSYKENTKQNCMRALNEFGPDGRILRGIFARK